MEKLKQAILDSNLTENEKITALKEIIVLIKNPKIRQKCQFNPHAKDINSMATWIDTPQGSRYWENLHAKLITFYSLH